MERFIFIFLFGILFFGCTPKSSVTEVPQDLPDRSAQLLTKELSDNYHRYEWLSSKTKLGFDDGNMNMSGTAILRIRKDSLIWFNVSKLGFEVARAIVRPDSVFMVNRLEKSYVAESLEYLSFKFNLPADFQMLQDLFYGNAILSEKEFPFDVSHDSIQYQLNYADKDIILTHWQDGQNFNLRKTAYSNLAEQKHISILFDGYEKDASGYNFSYFREFFLKDQKNQLSVTIKMTETEFNIPKKLRFDIPPHYEQVRL